MLIEYNPTGEPVTPHPQMSGPCLWSYQTSGVDTLDLGLHVEWSGWKHLERVLSDGKAKAIQSKEDASLIDLGIPDMIAQATGKAPMYQFGLTTPHYRLWIAARDGPSTYPNVYVSPSAAMLWQRGIQATCDQIEADIERIGGTLIQCTISRMDLCADILIHGGLDEAWLDAHRVSRATKIAIHRNDNTLETYHVGKGQGSIQLRIYDKSKEIRHSAKPWMRELWPSNPESDVWRVEYQLRRESLKQFSINTPGDLIQKIGGLWEYLTEKWFSLRIPDHAHATRRTTCDFWVSVQKVKQYLPESLSVSREITQGAGDLKRVLTQTLGYVKTYSAHRGLHKLPDAVLELGSELESLTTEQDFGDSVRCRAVRLGITH